MNGNALTQEEMDTFRDEYTNRTPAAISDADLQEAFGPVSFISASVENGIAVKFSDGRGGTMTIGLNPVLAYQLVPAIVEAGEAAGWMDQFGNLRPEPREK